MVEKNVSILIPTCNRSGALAVTLTSLLTQTYNQFEVIISDQSDEQIWENASFTTALRALRFHGHTVMVVRNFPRRGMAHQRQFLLEHVKTPYCLYLDDDVLLEPYVVSMMVKSIGQQQCGFVGQAVQGLSFLSDHRTHEEEIEYWEDRVIPERILPHGEKWQRYRLHNAANLMHIVERDGITPENPHLYKIAWVGGCVMYDTKKLQSSGGFTFWQQLPKEHAGEDVLAQLNVMKRFGGCGILPSGVYHHELPTTVKDRRVNAPEYLQQLL